MSLSYDDVKELLAVAREAATGCTFDERMTTLATRIGRVIHHASTMFTVLPVTPDPDVSVRLVQINTSNPEVIREYAEHYHKLDPTHERCRATIGHPFLLSEVVPHDLFGKDEYTSDCVQRAGIRHILGGWLPLPGGMALQLTFARPAGTEDFDARDLKVANLIAPDLIRAAFGTLLSERLAALRKRGSREDRAGVVVFDLRGELSLAQPTALKICERAAPTRGSRGDVLAPLVLELLRPRTVVGSTLERTVSLAGNEWAQVIATRTNVAIVCLLEVLSPGTARHAQAVSESYALTPRESEVATLAIKGLANKEIAALLELSPITVKLHLSNVFKKTRVESRTELAALFFARRGASST